MTLEKEKHNELYAIKLQIYKIFVFIKQNNDLKKDVQTLR